MKRALIAALLASAIAPASASAAPKNCGSIYRVDAGVNVKVTDVGHHHNCRLSRRVARNVYSDMSARASAWAATCGSRPTGRAATA